MRMIIFMMHSEYILNGKHFVTQLKSFNSFVMNMEWNYKSVKGIFLIPMFPKI